LMREFHNVVRKNELKSEVFIPDVQKWVKQITFCCSLFFLVVIYIVSFLQFKHPSVHGLLHSYGHFFISCCNFLMEPCLSQPVLSHDLQISIFSFSPLGSDVYSSKKVWEFNLMSPHLRLFYFPLPNAVQFVYGTCPYITNSREVFILHWLKQIINITSSRLLHIPLAYPVEKYHTVWRGTQTYSRAFLYIRT
jgi:hypothetical protein